FMASHENNAAGSWVNQLSFVGNQKKHKIPIYSYLMSLLFESSAGKPQALSFLLKSYEIRTNENK
ncbi:MAG: hypothetical protein ABR512_09765, partial [Desulfopila sp.]